MTMPNRMNVPKEIETQVLVKSGRRCCICYGVNSDFTDKKGQIAHLDKDRSNAELANLAFLCLEHHDEYDTIRSQSKGLTISEVKEYRTRLYEAVTQMRKGVWPIGLDVPLLKVYRRIDAVSGIPITGFQFTDQDPNDSINPPLLYLSVFFKTSRLFGQSLVASNEKWLYFEANMRFAFNLRIQVRALNERDVFELMDFLGGRNDGYELHGPRPRDEQAGDYFYMWRESDENRMIISTFTPTYASISIHARFSSEAVKAFADYLDEIGFTKAFV